MKFLLLGITILGLSAGCSNHKIAVKTANAYLVNELAIDGCSWHFEQHTGEETGPTAPSEDSMKKINPIIESAGSRDGLFRIPVQIEFSRTGKMRAIECGWGRKVEMPEVSIHHIEIAVPKE
ncbi:hypothetical protein GCM10023091_21750 [Ravibacter arvi]|uniref:Lipoprotein n=1 Tax=Ravibacter arvi TaxID=2051041 RepID=A0ABP8LZ44_9BACT